MTEAKSATDNLTQPPCCPWMHKTIDSNYTFSQSLEDWSGEFTMQLDDMIISGEYSWNDDQTQVTLKEVHVSDDGYHIFADDSVVYDVKTDTIINDIVLRDKYGDGMDGKTFTEVLSWFYCTETRLNLDPGGPFARRYGLLVADDPDPVGHDHSPIGLV